MMMPSNDVLGQLSEAIERSRPAFMRDLDRLVHIESGTYAKAGVDEVVAWMADALEELGASITRHANDVLGETLVATFEGHREGPTVMLVGHADTVFEPGYLAHRPVEIHGDHMLGPGVVDMKSGLLVGLYALRALRQVAPEAGAWLPVGRLVYVVNPDEEIGSPASSPIITDLARDADVAFVLEGARANGDIVSARKGMMHVRATITGRAAHAGVEPHKGRSAVLEAAHKTVALHELNGRWPGVSVNVGSLAGGTRPNIVPDEAIMLVDMRASRRDEQDEAAAAIREILAASTVADTTTAIEVTAESRPMEKTAASAKLVEQAVAIAAELGFDLADAATGGASDANVTAAAGIPTIDGLGPAGGDAHTPQEYMRLDTIAPRTALLAGLVLAQANRPQVGRRNTRT